MTRSIAAPLAAAALLMLALSPTQALAQDPLTAAVQEMHEADARGQWFSMSVAFAGAAPALALGGIALVDADRLGLEPGDALAQASSIGLLASGAGLIVHAIMRTSERRASAAASAELLRDADRMSSSGRFYLRDRAHKARSTRFLGGLLTVAQGASATLLGVASLLDEADSNILGYTMLPLGAITMGIGAIHFFGYTHPDRLLRSLEGEDGQGLRELQVAPVTALTARGLPSFALAISGRF